MTFSLSRFPQKGVTFSLSLDIMQPCCRLLEVEGLVIADYTSSLIKPPTTAPEATGRLSSLR